MHSLKSRSRGQCSSAEVQNVELVELLLAAGAHIDAEGSYYGGCTALYAATEAGHVEVVHTLLRARARVDLKSGNKKWSPLHIAHFKGCTDVKKVLEEAERPSRLKLATEGDGN